jgi:hypothetical protein
MDKGSIIDKIREVRHKKKKKKKTLSMAKCTAQRTTKNIIMHFFVKVIYKKYKKGK